MIPKHIAIIMDGNGRWAKKRFLPRKAGHKKGAERLLDIAKYCNQIGVEYLTVYAFSTENWKREKSEIEALMNLLDSYLDEFLVSSEENNSKVNIIGDISMLNEKLVAKINKVTELTKNNTGLNAIIAINYGGRDELVRGMKILSQEVIDGKIAVEDISEGIFNNYLDTKGVPDPDLLIRTSNELRLSNFLLWQVAYSELYFTETLWPDFSRKDLDLAIEEYSMRTRRFGGR